MNSDATPHSDVFPAYDAENETFYTIEVIADMAGVDLKTVLYYEEKGFIRPASRDDGDDALFDVECLRQLRRIAHLRATCDMNDAGLKLMLDLMHEIECLREERRQTLR